MYQKNNLYKLYKYNTSEKDYSSEIPDVTKKITLENLNIAINSCNKWDYFLDIGADNGHYSLPLLKKFRNGIAIEVNENEELSNIEEQNETFKVYSKKIEDIEINSKIDFISLIDVFEHIPDPNKLTNKISSFQDVGGVVFIIIPNTFYCGPAYESDIYYTKTKFGHIKHYTDKEMIDFFKNEKYELICDGFQEVKLSEVIRSKIRSVSRRDRKYKNKIMYKLIRPIVLFILKIILNIFEFMSYKKELESNYKNSRSRFYVFKKY